MAVHPNVDVTRAAEGLWRRRFTVTDVEAMVAAGTLVAGERIELIGGELVPMSPKGSRHERLKVALTRHWCKLAPDTIEVAQETTVRLSADTLLEPDLILSDRAQDFTGCRGPTFSSSSRSPMRRGSSTWGGRPGSTPASASASFG